MTRITTWMEKKQETRDVFRERVGSVKIRKTQF